LKLVYVTFLSLSYLVDTSTSPSLMRSPSFRRAALLAAAVPMASTKPEKSCSYSSVFLFLRLMDIRSFVLVSLMGVTSHTLANAPVRNPILYHSLILKVSLKSSSSLAARVDSVMAK
jgi:hypothetical protein